MGRHDVDMLPAQFTEQDYAAVQAVVGALPVGPRPINVFIEAIDAGLRTVGYGQLTYGQIYAILDSLGRNYRIRLTDYVTHEGANRHYSGVVA